VGVIETRGLTKVYGRQRGIEGLDLDIEAGEVFGFLGPNGAGKTTTIRLLLDLIRPTAGSVAVFGLDGHRDSVAIRRRLGYVPGELTLYESLSGRELLDFFGHLRGRVPRERAAELADRLGCELGREIRTLSHGNRQKLGLVAALMSDPELIVLDEPTNGLDPLVQAEFQQLVLEAHEARRTVFLSSHDLREVERVCDRVGIIREGCLLAVERVADLKARELRRLELVFAAPVPTTAFEGLAGVRDLAIEGATLRCAVVGSVDALLKAAARFETLAITTSEPSLEEIFLAFYGTEAPHAA